MNNNNQYWSDYWQTDGKDGEVFVNQKGEKPQYLVQHWQKELSFLTTDSTIIDLASGAGSIFDHLSKEDIANTKLYASDISQSALDIVKERIPTAQTVACSADSVPFDDHYFDMVVSQFGVEYAGVTAFKEAARILKPNGYLSILSHYQNGYIDIRNHLLLQGAKVVAQTDFINKAIELTKATFKGSPKQLKRAKELFTKAERPLSNEVKNNPDGIHAHLYFGFKKLYLNRQSYYYEDIYQWLIAMREDIKKNTNKISAIVKVSLSEGDMVNIQSMMESEGLKQVNISTLKIPDTEQIIAWHISARR